MKLIRLTCGLGNQMFIYAFYIQMKKRFPAIKLDISSMGKQAAKNSNYEIARIFHLKPDEYYVSKQLKKIMTSLFFKKVREKFYIPYSPKNYICNYCWPFVYYKGFFQSEKFFLEATDKVRDVFSFDEKIINKKTRACLRQIVVSESSVSIHIRRGDYLYSEVERRFGGICTLEYYQKAIKLISESINNPVFFIFSDDINWVKEKLPLNNATYTDWNSGNDSWQDMFLMSRCQHNIIANSTFSWWAAWLNTNRNKIVIAPERWFQDMETPNIHPEKSGWILIK
ncbi:O-antigen biosynthesis glycosyltransferase WbnK [termite gut metagenome]|uniref:O-antigen biosynthesis glycosyltransferase WbnK n=1 Tax=termite gut metagenome TaxID=433724 RepID=A0A5J4QE75_9ZZZZ